MSSVSEENYFTGLFILFTDNGASFFSSWLEHAEQVKHKHDVNLVVPAVVGMLYSDFVNISEDKLGIEFH